MPTPAIKITNLIKDYPSGIRRLKVRAVDNLNLTIEPNQIYGLLGPNGSGKSTTLKLILGLLHPTSGSCEIFGQSSKLLISRRNVGFLPESPCFYRYLTGTEFVRLAAKICLSDKSSLDELISTTINNVGLKEAANRRIETYSKGMLQRIGLAQAIIHNPDLIILDEPTAGVDPVGAIDFANIVLNLKNEGKTIIICSHLLSEIELICDRVAILNKGKLIAEENLNVFRKSKNNKALLIENFDNDLIDPLNEFLKSFKTTSKIINPPVKRLEEIYLDHLSSDK